MCAAHQVYRMQRSCVIEPWLLIRFEHIQKHFLNVVPMRYSRLFALLTRQRLLHGRLTTLPYASL
jgi:hypothetical protein